MGSLIAKICAISFRDKLLFLRGTFRCIFRHELFWIAILALVLRGALLPYFSTFSDPYFWARSLIFFNNGYDPYTVHISVYPPFIYLLYSSLSQIANWLGFSSTYFNYIPELEASIGTPAFLSFWKLPLVFFDFLTGFLIYTLTKELSTDSKLPKVAFAIWIFNPLNLVITYLHGAWDLIVGFSVLLGIFLIFKKNYLLGGLSFGLGVIAKLSPIYLVVPFSLLILLQTSKEFRISLRENISCLFRFLLGFGLPFLLFIPLILSYIGLYSYLPFSSSEGYIWNNFNQWFFAVHPVGFEWVNSNLSIIQRLPILYVVLSIVFVLLLARRKVATLTIERLLVFGVFFGILSYLFYPSIVQPQYVLWYLPLVACLAVVYKSFRLPFVIISVADILYYFARQGLMTPLAPLASYSGAFSIQLFQSTLDWYYYLPSAITGLFRYDVVFLSGLFGFIGFLIILLKGAKLLWKDEGY